MLHPDVVAQIHILTSKLEGKRSSKNIDGREFRSAGMWNENLVLEKRYGPRLIRLRPQRPKRPDVIIFKSSPKCLIESLAVWRYKQ
jgi:hypothetical protein